MTKFLRIKKSAIVACGFLAVSAFFDTAWSAHQAYMSLKGTKQGSFKGQSTSSGQKNRIIPGSVHLNPSITNVKAAPTVHVPAIHIQTMVHVH